VLGRLFRPEFLRKHVGGRDVPTLSSDAFSAFGDRDPDAEVCAYTADNTDLSAVCCDHVVTQIHRCHMPSHVNHVMSPLSLSITQAHRQDVCRAHDKLLRVVIPQLAEYLHQHLQGKGAAAGTSSTGLGAAEVSGLFHSFGVNMRYLGECRCT